MTVPEDEHARESAKLRLYVMTAIDAALRRYPEVIAAIAGAGDRAAAKQAVQEVLQIDELRATAVMDIQWGRLAADQVQAIADETADLAAFVDAPDSERPGQPPPERRLL